MTLQKYFLTSIFLLVGINQILGCHNALDGGVGSEDDDFLTRKRRQVSNIADQVTRTENLREFFSSCMLRRAGPLFDWDGVVDYSILDTLWYFTTNGDVCRNDTVECWQNRLSAYLRPTSSVLPIARDCIEELGVEQARNQGRNGRRAKRSYHHNYHTTRSPTTTAAPSEDELLMRRYSACVQSKLWLPRHRQRLNVFSVVEFVEENAICGECSKIGLHMFRNSHYSHTNRYARSVRSSSTTNSHSASAPTKNNDRMRSLITSLSSYYVPSNLTAHLESKCDSIEVYPFTFQALTLKASPLFNPIKICNNMFEDLFLQDPCDNLINFRGEDFCNKQQSWCENYPSYMNRSCAKTCCRSLNLPSDDPPNVGWTSWTPWGECPAPCGRTAVQIRKRKCPLGVPGIAPCIGDAVETRICRPQNCASWSSWSSWTACQVTCGKQVRWSSRTCISGRIGQEGCVGDHTRHDMCDKGDCFGSWTTWSIWSTCSVSCGGGQQSRKRKCTGGQQCQPDWHRSQFNQIRSCQTTKCPGSWTEWGSWSSCHVTCGGKNTYVFRRRKCNGGVVGSQGCEGRDYEQRECGRNYCLQSKWAEWSSWSDCSWKKRVRKCVGGPQDSCPGKATMYEVCTGCSNMQPVWSPWQPWSSCEGSCYYAVRRRQRHCTSNGSGYSCSGLATETQGCLPFGCYNGK